MPRSMFAFYEKKVPTDLNLQVLNRSRLLGVHVVIFICYVQITSSRRSGLFPAM